MKSAVLFLFCVLVFGELRVKGSPNTKIIVVGGRGTYLDAELAILPSIYNGGSYVTCSKPPNYPVPIEGGVGALIDNRFMVCGGRFDNSIYSSCNALDPATNTWIPNESDMNTERSFAAGVLVPNVGLWIAGGYDDVQALSSGELYDKDTSMWSYSYSLPRSLFGHCMVQLEAGRTFVGGGNSNNDDQIALPYTYFYDWDSNRWTTGPYFVTGRDSAACGVFNGTTLVVAGGYTGAGVTDFVEILDLNDPNAEWEHSLHPLPKPITGASLVQDGPDLILVGGAGNSDLYRLYDLAQPWELQGNPLVESNRGFATIEAVPDEALNGCH